MTAPLIATNPAASDDQVIVSMTIEDSHGFIHHYRFSARTTATAEALRAFAS
jgi:hypothetical protein